MNNERLFAACVEVVEELRQAVFIPWRTGNMATNSLPGVEYTSTVIADTLLCGIDISAA